MTTDFLYDIRAVLNIKDTPNQNKSFCTSDLDGFCENIFSRFRTGYVDIYSLSGNKNIKQHFAYGKDETDDVFDSCPINGGVTFVSSGNTITVGFDCLKADDILAGGRSEDFVLEECKKLIRWLKEKQTDFESA